MRITPEISKKPPRLEIVFQTWAKTFLLQNISVSFYPINLTFLTMTDNFKMKGTVDFSDFVTKKFGPI